MPATPYTTEDRETLMEIRSIVAVIRERSDEHHRTLFGNGSPGLKSKVERLTAEHERCPVIRGDLVPGVAGADTFRAAMLRALPVAVAIGAAVFAAAAVAGCLIAPSAARALIGLGQ